MKPTLKPGLTHRFSHTVPVTKMVPYLCEESPELAAMPEVFATGFMVGLMEWTCVQLLAPHLEAGEACGLDRDGEADRSRGLVRDVDMDAAAPHEVRPRAPRDQSP
jgi:fluoroacetyl-CoA thioesterase